MRWLKDCSIRRSHSVQFFYGEGVGSAHGRSGKTHFAFWGGSTKIKVFVVGILCYYSAPPGQAPKGEYDSVGGDEKLTGGGR